MKYFTKYLITFLIIFSSRGAFAQYEDAYDIRRTTLGYEVPFNIIIFKEVLQKDRELLKQNKVSKIYCYNVRDSINNEIFYIDTNGLVTQSSDLFKGYSEHFVYHYNSRNNLISVTSSGEKNLYDYKSDATVLKKVSAKILFDYIGDNISSISGESDSTSHFKYDLFYNQNNLLQKYIFAEDHIFIYSSMDKPDTTNIEYSKDKKEILLKGKNYYSFIKIKYNADTIKVSYDENETYSNIYILKNKRLIESQFLRDKNEIIYRRFFYYDESGLLVKKTYKNDFDNTEFDLLFKYEYFR